MVNWHGDRLSRWCDTEWVLPGCIVFWALVHTRPQSTIMRAVALVLLALLPLAVSLSVSVAAVLRGADWISRMPALLPGPAFTRAVHWISMSFVKERDVVCLPLCGSAWFHRCYCFRELCASLTFIWFGLFCKANNNGHIDLRGGNHLDESDTTCPFYTLLFSIMGIFPLK